MGDKDEGLSKVGLLVLTILDKLIFILKIFTSHKARYLYEEVNCTELSSFS